MDDAFQYVMNNSGITSQASYPYTSGGGVTGTCNTSKIVAPLFRIGGYQDITTGTPNCAAVATALGTNTSGTLVGRPLSVAVNANNAWQTYTGGVVSLANCPSNTLNHGVLLVAVNSTVWKIKNSWGTVGWGNAAYPGFIYLNAANGSNTCAVCDYASYPYKYL